MNEDIIKEAQMLKSMYETPNERGELPTVQQIARELGTAPARVSVLLELLNVPIRRGGKPQVIHTIEDLKARCQYDPKDENSCWLWQGSCDDFGYGTVSVAGKSRRVHQVALELTGVKLRRGQQTRRLCNYAHCCNPAHVAYRVRDVAVVDATRTTTLDRSRSRQRIEAPDSEASSLVPIADQLPAPASSPAAPPATTTTSELTAPDPLDFWSFG